VNKTPEIGLFFRKNEHFSRINLGCSAGSPSLSA
jgi:hypothetical protein